MRSGASEAGFHCAFALIHGVNIANQAAHEEPGGEANDDSSKDTRFHAFAPFRATTIHDG
jgi:hypothetical protein